jgi:formylglycine-generating enzyme required for sulfatase activity
MQRLEKLENPYPGLRPFETSEAHLFFGRDRQIAELIARLERNRFVAVVGVSGSGKSSLVSAGLIPALQHGRVTDSSERWRIVVSRPAGAPFANLARKLSGAGLDPAPLRQSSYGLIHVARHLPPDESLLVVVDQFEELFRYKDLETVTEESLRHHEQAASEAYEFVQLLLAASRYQPPVYVVITMRSDYLGECAEFRDLPEALNECQYLIPRLTRDQRRLAIECPLGATRISPALVQRVLNDAGDEPDQLPILQHALMRTWSQWRKVDHGRERQIELQDYEVAGGFQNALDQHADELLSSVPQSIAATVFKRLTARGRNQRERRDPARLAEMWELCDANTQEKRDEVTAVIDHFRRREATFLLPREGNLSSDHYIDIAHESLIRQWKILRDQWLPEETKSASTFLDLVVRAMHWKSRRGELLSGLDLTDALEWDRHRNPTASWARHYADASALDGVLEFIKASESEERKRERRRRRNFWIAIGACVVFALLAGWALYMRKQALDAITSFHKSETRASAAESHAVEALKEVVRRLELQLASNDSTQVSLALEQLISVHQRDPGEVLALVPDERFDSYPFFLALVTKLDDAGRDAKAGGWARRLRRVLGQRMSTARKIAAPPTEVVDDGLNKRVLANASRFRMGSPNGQGCQSCADEVPAHWVQLRAFYMQQHLVTNREYARFDPKYRTRTPSAPAVNVTWYDALMYAVWIGGNLPTEAQWEFAARGTDGRKYSWGNEEPRTTFARFEGPEHPNRPSAMGIWDLSGSVWQWCWDVYGRYPASEQKDPTGPNEGFVRVLRGGSSRDRAEFLRAAYRYNYHPAVSSSNAGFRVVWATTDIGR